MAEESIIDREQKDEGPFIQAGQNCTFISFISTAKSSKHT